MNERVIGIRCVFGVLASRTVLRRPRATVATVAGAAILCLAQLSSGRQGNPEVVRKKVVVAEAFLLGSAQAKNGGFFGIDTLGQASLSIFGGNPRDPNLHLAVMKDGWVGISLSTRTPQAEMDLTIAPSGTPALQLTGATQGDELEFSVDHDDGPVVNLSQNSDVKIEVGAPGQEGRASALVLYGTMGKANMRLADSRKLTAVSLFDNDGHVRSLMGLAPGRDPAFFIYDRDVHELLEMTEEADGSAAIRINNSATRESRVLK